MNIVYNNKISEKRESNNRKRFYIDIIYESVRLLLKKILLSMEKELTKKIRNYIFNI